MLEWHHGWWSEFDALTEDRHADGLSAAVAEITALRLFFLFLNNWVQHVGTSVYEKTPLGVADFLRVEDVPQFGRYRKMRKLDRHFLKEFDGLIIYQDSELVYLLSLHLPAGHAVTESIRHLQFVHDQ